MALVRLGKITITPEELRVDDCEFTPDKQGNYFRIEDIIEYIWDHYGKQDFIPDVNWEAKFDKIYNQKELN